MKTITLLGSSGSIGENTLRVAQKHSNIFKIRGLSVRSDIKKLISQVYKFRPEYICVFNEDKREEIKNFLPSNTKLLPPGVEGLIELIKKSNSQITVTAISGAVGLLPLIVAVEKSERVCIANKEPMVMAGEIIMDIARKKKTEIIPIDSEPSAIFQSINGFDKSFVRKIILTASGGPFYSYNGDLSKVTPQQAIKHPRWRMGRKISVDSATLMNKGLEAIEIKNLFDIDISKIEVLIHPQSIVHSAVEFVDGSVIAQLSNPDMRIPIQFSLTYPRRFDSSVKKLSLLEVSKLEFFKADIKKFKAIELAFKCAKKGGVYPSILNASNEVAVDMFLKGKIKFTDIINLVDNVIKVWCLNKKNPQLNIENIIEADEWARKKTQEITGNR